LESMFPLKSEGGGVNASGGIMGEKMRVNGRTEPELCCRRGAMKGPARFKMKGESWLREVWGFSSREREADPKASSKRLDFRR